MSKGRPFAFQLSQANALSESKVITIIYHNINRTKNAHHRLSYDLVACIFNFLFLSLQQETGCTGYASFAGAI